jgi:hypothetical protein
MTALVVTFLPSGLRPQPYLSLRQTDRGQTGALVPATGARCRLGQHARLLAFGNCLTSSPRATLANTGNVATGRSDPAEGGSGVGGGNRLWAYRYRTGGRDSKRVQRGGFVSSEDAREALERELGRMRSTARLERQ